MIGRARLPQHHLDWNARWGAPEGGPELRRIPIGQRLRSPDRFRMGPFAFQPHSGTRVFEYPWAYFALAAQPGMRVLEVGGGIAGLQFVLDAEGAEVTNVDPLALEDNDWADDSAAGYFARLMTTENHRIVNDTFGADVELIPKKLQDCAYPAGHFDRIVALSVLEHLDPEEARAVLAETARLLALGGILVLTVDLFFDVLPLGSLARNGWGTNHDLRALLDGLDLTLVAGDPRELLGFEEFDKDRVVRSYPELMTGVYPVVSQSLALRRDRAPDGTSDAKAVARPRPAAI